MKYRTLALTLLLAALPAVAQNNPAASRGRQPRWERPMKMVPRTHFNWGASAAASVDMAGYDMSAMDIDMCAGISHGWLNFLGVGAQANMFISNTSRSYPVYAAFRTNFSNSPSRIFWEIKGGEAYNTLEGNRNGWNLYGNTSLGVNLSRSSSVNTYLSLGYTYIKDAAPYDATGKDLHLATVRFGALFSVGSTQKKVLDRKKPLKSVKITPEVDDPYSLNRIEQVSREGFTEVRQSHGPTLGISNNSPAIIVKLQGLAFKNFDGTRRLKPYEDWRLSPERRAADLVGRLSIEDIAGLMMSCTLDSALSNTPMGISAEQRKNISEHGIKHLIINDFSSPREAARRNNAIQTAMENSPMGIPGHAGSDPHHSAQASDKFTLGTTGNISLWSSLLGLASTFDPTEAERLGRVMQQEYRALGISTALSPQNIPGVLPELADDIIRAYCNGLQAAPGSADGSWAQGSVVAAVAPQYGARSLHGATEQAAVIIADTPVDRNIFSGAVCTTAPETAAEYMEALEAGADIFRDVQDPSVLLDAFQLYANKYGRAEMQKRVRQSAQRLLLNMFRTGLFENPYVDPIASIATVGKAEFMKIGYEQQLKSVVLLKNHGRHLPLQGRPKIYIAGNILPTLAAQRYFEVVDSPTAADAAIAPADETLLAPLRKKMGNKPLIAIIDLTAPLALDKVEPLADILLAGAGVQSQVYLDILAGQSTPSGLLPFHTPGHKAYRDADGNTYRFGFGLNLKGPITDWRTRRYIVE